MHPSLDPDLWSEAVTDTQIMVADGQTVKICVRNGRLQVEDGVPGKRRQRHISRVPRQITRLIILARCGYITLEAFRWLHDAKIQVTHIAEDITMTGGSMEGDYRIVPEQSNPDKNLAIVRYLISAKIQAQSTVLLEQLNAIRPASSLQDIASRVAVMNGYEFIVASEGAAASKYWKVWKDNVHLLWSPADTVVVPSHWRVFPGRLSLARQWETNRSASDPINAILNYAYKVLETEALTACRIYGIHPDLGILHKGGTDRHAFALDLMEPVRPFVDRLVLQLIDTYRPPEYFDRRWCHEMRDGKCVLDPPLTHVISGWAIDIGARVREYAATVREVYKSG